MVSFKNRWKIIQDEIVEKKWKRIYIERKIKELIRNRYADGSIKTNSSYVYQKMDKLLAKKIYMPVRNSGYYVHQVWFMNVFELHKRLDQLIRAYHIPQRKSSLYTKEEKEYMEYFLRSRKIIEDRGIYVEI